MENFRTTDEKKRFHPFRCFQQLPAKLAENVENHSVIHHLISCELLTCIIHIYQSLR